MNQLVQMQDVCLGAEVHLIRILRAQRTTVHAAADCISHASLLRRGITLARKDGSSCTPSTGRCLSFDNFLHPGQLGLSEAS